MHYKKIENLHPLYFIFFCMVLKFALQYLFGSLFYHFDIDFNKRRFKFYVSLSSEEIDHFYTNSANFLAFHFLWQTYYLLFFLRMTALVSLKTLFFIASSIWYDQDFIKPKRRYTKQKHTVLTKLWPRLEVFKLEKKILWRNMEKEKIWKKKERNTNLKFEING
jgi:hypothetical protein